MASGKEKLAAAAAAIAAGAGGVGVGALLKDRPAAVVAPRSQSLLPDAGQPTTGVDGGYILPLPGNKGFVFDANRNGKQDPGELVFTAPTGLMAPDCSSDMPVNTTSVEPGFHMSQQEADAFAQKIAEQGDLWSVGKHQTFPYLKDSDGTYGEYAHIDVGTLGPDVDAIFGLDFEGDIPTNATVIYQPEGEVLVTRVVGIKRTDLNYVQFCEVLGGDVFELQKMSEHGGDEVLDAMARLHAYNSAHEHTKVVFIGDLGAFEEQWGEQEKALLNRMIHAQFPGNPELGLDESNFADTNR